MRNSGHHRADQQHHQEEAGEDVDRHGDEEHLQLRHQAREQADAGVDGEPEHEKRCGELQSQRERTAGEPDGEFGHVAGGQCSTGRQKRVASLDGADGEMMQVGGEDEHRAHQREEIADDGALLAHFRIDRLRIAKAGLRGDEIARGRQRAHDDARHAADQRAGGDLLGDQQAQREHRLRRIAGVGA